MNERRILSTKSEIIFYVRRNIKPIKFNKVFFSFFISINNIMMINSHKNGRRNVIKIRPCQNIGYRKRISILLAEIWSTLVSLKYRATIVIK